jgi:hypothetical protein
LYVVDGIPISSQELDNGNNTDGVNQQSRVADINPNSIESVTILKGFCLRFMGIQSCERSYTTTKKVKEN